MVTFAGKLNHVCSLLKPHLSVKVIKVLFFHKPHLTLNKTITIHLKTTVVNNMTFQNLRDEKGKMWVMSQQLRFPPFQ